MLKLPGPIRALAFLAASGHLPLKRPRLGDQPVKPREERQKVMIRARMRSGVSWHDVCILNLSARGLGIQAAEPPSRGTYVEVRRGKQVIVARVMWAKGHRAGLHSQDAIWIQALLREESAANDQAPATAYPKVERRLAPRSTQQRHDESRMVARATEFACMAIAVVALGLTLFGTVEQALARPLTQIRAALGPG